MIDRGTKLRLRRKYRKSRRQVEDMGVTAEEGLDKHLFKNINKLTNIRRFVFSWVMLLVLMSGVVIYQTNALNGYYLNIEPVSGGIYSEGIVGSFTNVNPIYATNLVDSSVSRLVFASLLKLNDKNQLVGDLAQNWKVSPDGKTYTVNLKPNLVWHDGKPLTAEDVRFTFQTIQHPDAKSPLFQAWREVVVKDVDAKTVTFTLKSELGAFAYGLTVGIIPKHSFAGLTPDQIRSSRFNTTSPIGSGPFAWRTIETTGSSKDDAEQHIGLRKFEKYNSGEPRLDEFIINTYPNQDKLIEDFKNQKINAIVGLNEVPDAVVEFAAARVYSSPLMAANMAFFKTDSPLLADVKVRQALAYAVNIDQVIKEVGYPAIEVDEPVLKDQVLYDPKFRQLTNDINKANALLDQAGFVRPGAGQARMNGQTKLTLKLRGQNSQDFTRVSQLLQKAWQEVGVQVDVVLQTPEELQSTITERSYDILLNAISIGPDPDVFAYWHSSQFDTRSATRLNLSNYKSTVADRALESSRSRTDIQLRKIRLTPFLQAWQTDVPAIGLYQPQFLYLSHGKIYNYEIERLASPPDRFWNVQDWMIRQGKALKQ